MLACLILGVLLPLLLFPKKDNPQIVSNYRIISLCNVCYKIIAKILANRLKIVISNLIGGEQSGFISGRSSMDNIVAIQEIVHSLEKNCRCPPRVIIKIDIEKNL